MDLLERTGCLRRTRHGLRADPGDGALPDDHPAADAQASEIVVERLAAFHAAYR